MGVCTQTPETEGSVGRRQDCARLRLVLKYESESDLRPNPRNL